MIKEVIHLAKKFFPNEGKGMYNILGWKYWESVSVTERRMKSQC